MLEKFENLFLNIFEKFLYFPVESSPTLTLHSSLMSNRQVLNLHQEFLWVSWSVLSAPQYLNLERSFEGKDYVCDRLLQFLQDEAAAGVTEKLSFQLMEALLYRVQLSLFTGRMESALAVLQVELHLQVLMRPLISRQES